MCKYKIFSVTNHPHYPQQNPSEQRTQIYKKGETPSLTEPLIPDICFCMIFCFRFVYITVCLNLPLDTSDHEIDFGANPDIRKFMRYILYWGIRDSICSNPLYTMW